MTGAWLPHSDLLEWLVLRRVVRGGVAMAGSTYLDEGRPFPAELVRALPQLLDAGYVDLAPADAWGLRRATLTAPTGRDRYSELTATRDLASRCSATGGRGAPIWVLSTFDDRVHTLAPHSPGPPGKQVALCGLVLEASAKLTASPHSARVCGTCTAIATA